MNLPTEKTDKITDFSKLTTLIYGESKIGKSTFCAGAEGALFLSTEPGLNHLSTYKIDIRCWNDLRNACKEISIGKHEFKTIIIDTIDNAYDMCREHILKEKEIEHESDLGYGKGFVLVNKEFSRVINKLAFLQYGLIFVSHSKEKEIDTRVGKKLKITTSLPNSAAKFITGIVDIILYCDIRTTINKSNETIYERVIRTQPTEKYIAGDRTGILKETIKLDYKSFINEFNKTERKDI